MDACSFHILVINPGSTSTKVGIYRNDEPVHVQTYRHTREELAQYPSILDQLEWRERLVRETLLESGFSMEDFHAIAARGGRIKGVSSGTYRVNQLMLEHARMGLQGEHASSLACIIAARLAEPYRIPAYVVDPVTVDELTDIARISGLKEIPRTSLSHALNMKAVARKAAVHLGIDYRDARFIVAHMGGGGSVSAHAGGRMIDLYNSDKEGPFTSERAGGIPTLELVDLCFSGKYTKESIVRKLVGGGGLVSYLGTTDAVILEERVRAGDTQTRLILEAMAYQFAKYIGALAAVLEGDVHAVVLTGGMAHSELIVQWIRERVRFIAPILLYPGECEMEALASGVLRVLTGEEEPRVYE